MSSPYCEHLSVLYMQLSLGVLTIPELPVHGPRFVSGARWAIKSPQNTRASSTRVPPSIEPLRIVYGVPLYSIVLFSQGKLVRCDFAAGIPCAKKPPIRRMTNIRQRGGVPGMIASVNIGWDTENSVVNISCLLNITHGLCRSQHSTEDVALCSTAAVLPLCRNLLTGKNKPGLL